MTSSCRSGPTSARRLLQRILSTSTVHCAPLGVCHHFDARHAGHRLRPAARCSARTHSPQSRPPASAKRNFPTKWHVRMIDLQSLDSVRLLRPRDPTNYSHVFPTQLDSSLGCPSTLAVLGTCLLSFVCVADSSLLPVTLRATCAPCNLPCPLALPAAYLIPSRHSSLFMVLLVWRRRIIIMITATSNATCPPWTGPRLSLCLLRVPSDATRDPAAWPPRLCAAAPSERPAQLQIADQPEPLATC